MLWQDGVMIITSIMFSYALIPQVYKGFKLKKGLITLQTSSINTIGMCACTFVYFSLNLFFSGILMAITAIMWATLTIQKLIYK